MNDTIHTEEYKGFTINIERDDMPESPRDWDNLGTMVCFHRDYKLGDETNISKDSYSRYNNFGNEEHVECNSWADIKEQIRYKTHYNNDEVAVILPLGLYDHSGITMYIIGDKKNTQYMDWDSGQVGFIYVTKDKLRKEYSVKNVTKATLEKAEKILRDEVKIYDNYLTGEVYVYSAAGEVVGGYYGDEGIKQAIEDAKAVIDYKVKELAEKRALLTKKQIAAKLPLIYRK